MNEIWIDKKSMTTALFERSDFLKKISFQFEETQHARRDYL